MSLVSDVMQYHPMVIITKAAFDNQEDELLRMNEYILKTTPLTPKAVEVQARWVGFYNSLNFFDRHANKEAYDKARNLLRDYDLANALSAADKQRWEDFYKNQLTKEEIDGEGKRALASGRFSEPLVPLEWKLWAAGAGLGALAVYIAYKAFMMGTPTGRVLSSVRG